MNNAYKARTSCSLCSGPFALWLLMCSMLFAALFILGVSSVYAQEDTTAGSQDTAVTQTDQAADETENGIEEESTSEEALLDEAVSIEDLGAQPAQILPDSPFHVFKRWGRGIQEAFTFDPIADATLKLEHANQQLAETKQLIDQNGLANVNPIVIQGAIEAFNSKLGDVRETATSLKNEKAANPEAIDALLTEVTEKQLKQQKVLESISNDVFEIKQTFEATGEGEVLEIEAVLAQVEDTRSDSLGNLTSILIEVEDNSNDIGTRLTDVMQSQTGSTFKDLKNLEILESIRSKVPESAKGAIDAAKASTLKNFEIKIQDLPSGVRAERFANYVSNASADETLLLSLLDQIKQSAGIPPDMLASIEQVKEIAVRNFETKLRFINDDRVEARYFKRFKNGSVDDLVVLEELKNRMRAESEELRQMEELHEVSIADFKSAFTDAQSQDQAALFQKLSREMERNPSPKTFRLLQELEGEVRADPTKAAFLDSLEGRMKGEFERRFEQEGDRFMDRLATLDPKDMAVFDDVGFDASFVDRISQKQVGKFNDFMQNVYIPDEFDRFHERFFDAPEEVIQRIKDNDAGFEQAIQFKMRKMVEVRANQENDIERARIDYQEREVNFEFDRLARQQEDEFWNKLNSIPWENFAERKQLWDEKINQAYERVEARFSEQKTLFEKRIANDPWCDEVCRQIQIQFLNQELRHKKEQLADDLKREKKRIELEKTQFQQNNPLAGVCNGPEECEQYCSTNPNNDACGIFITTFPVFCDPPGFIDQTGACVYPDNPDDPYLPFLIDCIKGQYYDPGVGSCVPDPYYRPPTDFVNCGPGMFWDDFFGHCKPFENKGNDCGPNMYWDFASGTCFPIDGPVTPDFCPDYYEPVCGVDNITYTNECQARSARIAIQYFNSCGNVATQCSHDEYWAPELSRCLFEGSYIPSNPGQCDEGWFWKADGYCERDSSFTQCAATYCEPSCGPNSYCQYNQLGCATGCVGVCPAGQVYENGTCVGSTDPNNSDNWVSHTWVFNDGSRETSFIMNRTDSAYLDFIARIDAQCLTTSHNNFAWSPDAGNDADWNWEKFGIPACNGTTSTYCPPPAYWDANSNSCQAPEHPGDENTCPGFAYSMWDNNGNRYCVLNNVRSCSGNYPDYLDANTYSVDYCPDDGTNPPIEDNCPAGTHSHAEDGGYCINDQDDYSGLCYDINGTTQITCPTYSDTDYPGDANSCPGFAYSVWDSTGSRYCRLNDQESCNFFYPEYLDRVNYSPDRCPADSPDYGDCKVHGNENTCYAQPGCQWYNQASGTGFCDGDDYCPSPSYWDSSAYQCVGGETCSPTIYNDWRSSASCNYNECSDGCNYENGCPVSCLDTTSSACNYDGVCNGSETEATCSADCVPTTTGYCGDNICNNGESISNCYADCQTGVGTCPATVANNYSESLSCDYSQCSVGCNWDSQGCPTTCMSQDEMCANMDGWHYDSGTNTCVRDGVTCSNSNACSACPMDNDPASYSSSWCQYDGDGCPTGCQDSSSTGWCGDNVCNSGETASSCSQDCGGSTTFNCPSGYHSHDDSGGYCINDAENYSGTCYNSEGTTVITCPTYAGDYGSCTNYTDSSSCSGATNCNWYESGSSSYCYYDSGGGNSSEWCGDNTCTGSETPSSCPADCGSGTTSCPSTLANDYTDSSSCSSTCSQGCNYENGCPTTCWESSAGWCGDNTCDSNEDSSWCPTDCGGGSSTNYCDGICGNGEDSSCPGDCGSTSSSCPSTIANDYTNSYTCSSTCSGGCNYDSQGCPSTCWESTAGYCGDNVCDGNEDSTSCSVDCGSVQGTRVGESKNGIFKSLFEFFGNLF